jgi:hypothetical protein
VAAEKGVVPYSSLPIYLSLQYDAMDILQSKEHVLSAESTTHTGTHHNRFPYLSPSYLHTLCLRFLFLSCWNNKTYCRYL